MLAPEAPYPLTGGGATRTASLLEWLARRYEVDLVVFQEPGNADPREALPAGLVGHTTVIPLVPHARHLAARIWRNAGRFVRGAPPLNDRFSGYELELAAALGEKTAHRYEIGVIEHFWCAGYAPLLRPHCRRLVMDLHNVESMLHRRNAASSHHLERLMMARFAGALERLECSVLPVFDSALTPSTEDAKVVAGLAPHLPVIVYPNAIPAVARPETSKDTALVFSGNFRYHPNRRAVEYFYREIWPVLAARNPELVWRLIGKHPEAVRDIIAGDPRVECTGPVDNAIAAIARGQAAVVPLLSGSGTRVKILEAWAAGVPVVSTPIGAEGLAARPGVEICIAQSPEEFAAVTQKLLDSPSLRKAIGDAGRKRYEDGYTWEAAWRKLDAANL
jgi:glycosyltransferase involved in cell wall biosynthesis